MLFVQNTWPMIDYLNHLINYFDAKIGADFYNIVEIPGNETKCNTLFI